MKSILTVAMLAVLLSGVAGCATMPKPPSLDTQPIDAPPPPPPLETQPIGAPPPPPPATGS